MTDTSALLLTLRQEALRLLSRREHSRAELAQKLANRMKALPICAEVEPEVKAAALTNLLDELGQRQWQSDERFANQRVSQRGARYGNRRLAQELEQRGISADGITNALEKGEDEITRCRTVWLKKFREPAKDRDAFAKQMRFLLYRGFSSQTIRQVMKSSPEELCETDDECPTAE